MKIFKFILFTFLCSLFLSCSKDLKEQSVLKEKSLDLQMIEAYNEGLNSLKAGDVLLQQKSLMKLRFYIHNLYGLQDQH